MLRHSNRPNIRWVRAGTTRCKSVRPTDLVAEYERSREEHSRLGRPQRAREIHNLSNHPFSWTNRPLSSGIELLSLTTQLGRYS